MVAEEKVTVAEKSLAVEGEVMAKGFFCELSVAEMAYVFWVRPLLVVKGICAPVPASEADG